MTETYEQIAEVLLTVGPTIVSVLATVITLFKSMKQLKGKLALNEDTFNKSMQYANNLNQQVIELNAENAALRKELVRLTKRAYNIYDEGEE